MILLVICEVLSLLERGRQAARLGRLPGSGWSINNGAGRCRDIHFAHAITELATHNKQPINTSPSLLRSRSCNCLGKSFCHHHVFFMTIVSSLRDVKHVALRAKQQPHHLPRSHWEPTVFTYGRNIIIPRTTQARQHVQQKSPSRQCSQRC